ncbi:hypothetical protein RFI_01166 [Reticulomyxa filosa]|uniref:Viral A-type inclusion protein n=1 Tax=Reticulomyxa filosa TaxID=46433 RepID=X6PCJ4_RETFI|nr:hypothetical protein RFI_01166 [Reticulomyxa filosa]|eukprot:ETO35896.1 hypothetical protein RFI_01166 [Reticulomyxa filosa]
MTQEQSSKQVKISFKKKEKKKDGTQQRTLFCFWLLQEDWISLTTEPQKLDTFWSAVFVIKLQITQWNYNTTNTKILNKIKKLKDHLDKLYEQVNNVKHESLKKDQQIMELTKNIQELQSEMNQNKIEFKKQLEQSQHKQVIQNNLDNQRRYISRLQSQTDVQNEERKREEKNTTKYERNVTCQNMLAVIRSPCLNNGVDFLLMNENQKFIVWKRVWRRDIVERNSLWKWRWWNN